MKPASTPVKFGERGGRGQVFVEVSPSRLEVALFSGESLKTRVHNHTASEWTAQWPAVLCSLDEALASMVEELGAAGSSATVIYTAPTAHVSVCSCPASAGKKAADLAAALALTGGCTFSTEQNPSQIVPFMTDAAAKGDQAQPPQAHSLGLADTDDSAQAVAEWAAGAGLVVERCVPADAPATLGALAAAKEKPVPDSVCAGLFFGDHTSVLAAILNGRLCFVRTLALGADSLVDALTRPIRVRPGADGAMRPPINLERDAARDLLFGIGVPGPESVVDAQRGIDGSALLPLLQPVLQRICVEVKQSLRFGMEEAAAKAPVRLSIAGPGGSIPQIGAVIARLCGLSHGVENLAPAAGASAGSAQVGLISILRLPGAPSVGLLPSSLEKAASIRSMRRAIWAGLAASACLVAWDGYQARTTLASEKARVEQLRRQVASTANTTALQEQAQAARDRVAAFEDRIRDQMGEWVDWSALLGILADQTPDTIRLTGLELTGGGASTCKLAGYVDTPSTVEGAAAIGHFMSTIGQTPVVRNVELGATQRVRRDARDVQQFELSINLIGLPAVAQAPATLPAEPTAGAEAAP